MKEKPGFERKAWPKGRVYLHLRHDHGHALAYGPDVYAVDWLRGSHEAAHQKGLMAPLRSHEHGNAA